MPEKPYTILSSPGLREIRGPNGFAVTFGGYDQGYSPTGDPPGEEVRAVLDELNRLELDRDRLLRTVEYYSEEVLTFDQGKAMEIPDSVRDAAILELAKRKAEAGDAAGRMLRDLLALAHRDGGRYTAEHGVETSFRDAKVAISKAIGGLESLAEDRDHLLFVLRRIVDCQSEFDATMQEEWGSEVVRLAAGELDGRKDVP